MKYSILVIRRSLVLREFLFWSLRLSNTTRAATNAGCVALVTAATSEISVVDFAYVERRCKRPMRQSRVNVLRAGLSGL